MRVAGRSIVAVALMLWGAVVLAGSDTERSLIDLLTPDYRTYPLVQPLVSELRDGESLVIRMATKHCFGGNTYEIRILGGTGLRVIVSGRADAVVTGALLSLGETFLTGDEAFRVDRLIAYYRSKSGEATCTAQTELTAVWETGSGIKTESWFDGSCATLGKSEEALSFGEIVGRATREP